MLTPDTEQDPRAEEQIAVKRFVSQVNIADSLDEDKLKESGNAL